ncbi:DUF4399 domain-containing protein [Bosea lathyri]|uniref:DUF4399 domain-containing protein n=1 Tax=Bosea lathyri TaxID=1036778 RepID=A0A1H6BTG1_9HYPH|nr:DUF4399 domain-containing protein [Bosea lathyri]SEG63940.1 protein of unknown function [Bosea lathyri]
MGRSASSIWFAFAVTGLLPMGALAQTAPTPKPPTPQRAPAPDARLYIIYPWDGAQIRGEFWVRFGLRNMGVTQAGSSAANAGHHHLLVDVTDEIDPEEPLPTDNKHLHFGAGQTEARLELPPGKHTLQLVLGDPEHRPFKPMLISKKVTITVLTAAPARTSKKVSGKGA